MCLLTVAGKIIQEINSFQTMEKCIDYLCEKALELVSRVKENTIPTCYSTLINRCIHFIHVNLHSRLKIETIAGHKIIFPKSDLVIIICI